MTTGVLISAIGLSITLLGFVIKLSTKVGAVMEQLKNLETKQKEYKESSEKNFAELYTFRSDTQKDIARMTESLININNVLMEIKQDIKELKK